MDDAGHARDGDATRKPPADAARHEQIADRDLVGALHELDAEIVFVELAFAANEAARAGALDDDVDPEVGVDDELHVDGVARHALDGADDAAERDDRHVALDVAAAAIDREPIDPEILGDLLADDLRGEDVARQALAQPEQSLQAPVLRFLRLEPTHALFQARRVEREPLVVGLHIDEINVVAPKVRETPRKPSRPLLNRLAHPHDRPIELPPLLRIADVRAQKQERHEQRDEENPHVADRLHLLPGDREHGEFLPIREVRRPGPIP